MNIDQLKYFVSVVENKNFSVAAEECFISQSSLSKNIKALEEELGNIQLLDRSGKKVIVTEAGNSFYKYAQNMLKTIVPCEGKCINIPKMYVNSFR